MTYITPVWFGNGYLPSWQPGHTQKMGDRRQHLGYLASANPESEPSAAARIFRTEEWLKGIVIRERRGGGPKHRLLLCRFLLLSASSTARLLPGHCNKKALNHPKPHKDVHAGARRRSQRCCGWTTCYPCSERRSRMRGRPYVVGRLELCALTRMGE